MWEGRDCIVAQMRVEKMVSVGIGSDPRVFAVPLAGVFSVTVNVSI